MSNVKISQLPSYTGNTSGSWLVMNNSGETITYKVQKETLLSGFQPSGNYATTGSNNFFGNQTISGSVTVSGSAAGVGNGLNVIGNSLFSGSVNIQGSSAAGAKYLFFASASGSAGGIISYQTSGELNIIQSDTGSCRLFLGNPSGSNTLYGNTNITGSSHKIVGDTTITGSITNKLPNGGTITTRGLIGSGTTNLNINSGTSGSVIQLNSQNFSQIVGYGSISDGFALNATNSSGFELCDYSTSPVPFLTIASNVANSNPALQFKRSVAITGSLNVSSSLSNQNNLLSANKSAGNNIIVAAGNLIEAHSNTIGNKLLSYNNSNNVIQIDSGGTGKNIIIGTTDITGSVNISTALKLAKQDPLPTGTTGSLAVSGSGLYFHNGTSWSLIS